MSSSGLGHPGLPLVSTGAASRQPGRAPGATSGRCRGSTKSARSQSSCVNSLRSDTAPSLPHAVDRRLVRLPRTSPRAPARARRARTLHKRSVVTQKEEVRGSADGRVLARQYSPASAPWSLLVKFDLCRGAVAQTLLVRESADVRTTAGAGEARADVAVRIATLLHSKNGAPPKTSKFQSPRI